MAKELPYYKHEPSEWLEGEIQVCSDAAIVCFTNLRDGYWLKLGCISYAFALQKYCRRDASILQELIDNGIVDLENDQIKIRFLDLQLKEFNDTSEKRKRAAHKRWEKSNEDASAMQLHSKSNAIREDKIREDKIRKEEKTEKKEVVPTVPVFNFKKSMIDLGFYPELVDEWLLVRKQKKATNSETSFKMFMNEVLKLPNMDRNEILRVCVGNSWKGFKVEWLNNLKNNTNGNSTNNINGSFATSADAKISEYTKNVLASVGRQDDRAEAKPNNENGTFDFTEFKEVQG